MYQFTVVDGPVERRDQHAVHVHLLESVRVSVGVSMCVGVSVCE